MCPCRLCREAREWVDAQVEEHGVGHATRMSVAALTYAVTELTALLDPTQYTTTLPMTPKEYS